MSIEIVVALISTGTTLIAVFLSPIVKSLVNKYFNSNIRDPLKEAIGINNLITSKLEEIKDTHKTDRVWLCQFHNGGYFYPTGKSMQKFSMVYEILSEHASSQQHQFQNIPIGLFSKSINKLASGEPILISNYSKDDGYGLESFAEANNTKSGYLFPIMTIDNKFIGVIGIDYLTETKLNKEQVNNIIIEVSSIGGTLMSNYLNKK